MQNQKYNNQKQIRTRVIILLMSLLVSKNVEIEIIRPNLMLKISIESTSIQYANKLIKWFENQE